MGLLGSDGRAVQSDDQTSGGALSGCPRSVPTLLLAKGVIVLVRVDGCQLKRHESSKSQKKVATSK